MTGVRKLASMYGQNDRWTLYDKSGICPCLTASMGMGGGFRPMIAMERGCRAADL